jgi:4-hydroxy-3-polyprenylbenzoate decarboxylase
MNHIPEPKRIIVGVSGASGAAYARRLMQLLVDAGIETHAVFSPNGRRLFVDELDIHDVSAESLIGRPTDLYTLHAYKDIGGILASGSFKTAGMVVCPCSTHSMASIAAGIGDNILIRAAAVTLKERRRLIIVPREMPFSHIDLLNATRLSEAGAIICPPAPGFYMRPETIDDIVDFVAAKILDLFDVPHRLNTHWADQVERATDTELL